MQVKYDNGMNTIIAKDVLGDYRIVERPEVRQARLSEFTDARSNVSHQTVFRLDGSFVSKKDVVTRCEECNATVEVGEKYYVQNGAWCTDCYPKLKTKNAL